MRNIIYLQFPQMSFRSSLVFSGCTRQQFVLLDTRKHQLEIKEISREIYFSKAENVFFNDYQITQKKSDIKQN